MYPSYRKLFHFILCLLPLISFGQESNGNHSLFFEEPYVLQRAELNSVKCIFKDSHHIMWFGTDNGLYRYDGVNLRYFGHRMGDSNSLPNNKVLSLAEDKEGKLWVGMIAEMAEIDLNTLQCRTFSAANNRFDAGNFTNKVCIDDSGNVWVGNNFGIFLFDKKNQLFKNVWNDKLSGNNASSYISSIVNIDAHTLAASTFHDLILFNKNTYSFKRIQVTNFTPPKDTIITNIFLDSKHKLWIGSWGFGVYTYNPATGELTNVKALNPLLNHWSDDYVTSFYETVFNKQRYIWVSTSGGLIKCFIDDNSIVTDYALIDHDEANKHSIIPGKLESLYLDNDRALWCAGDRGICKCFPFQNSFELFASLKGYILNIQPVNLQHKNYYFIHSWNSKEGNGFLLLDSIGKEAPFKIEPHFNDKDDGKNISGIAEDKFKRYWIAGLAGVCVLNDKLEVVKQWNKNTSGDDNLTYYRTGAITIYHDTVWIASRDKGIDLFDLSFHKLIHYNRTDNSGLKDNLISMFFTDSKGNLWLCGDGELYKYIRSTRKFKSYKLTDEANTCSPRDITEAKNGNLIIGSLKGVIQFNPITEKSTYILSDILQKEQNVYSVATDKKGDIWFLTDEHLIHYKCSENKFILFGKEDGLDVDNGIFELRTFNGTDFYICQNDRVIKFNCDSLKQPTTPPYLVFSMQVNDSIIYPANISGNLNLAYNKNKIQFDFTGVSYIKADQNQYYYQLSEVDKQWNTTYKNSVSYANLPPGNYTFNVKTVNYAGMWSGEKTITFVINPPYWQSWWFRLVFITFIGSVFYVIIRYISQRNLKEKILQLEKETAIEKERNRIAQDMHDDLGSGLTKIAILSEVVKKQLKQPEKASEQLERISDSSRTLVDNLQDIIWMLNTRHDQLESLAIYIREYATKYFEQSDIAVLFDYPQHIEPIKIPEEQRRNLFMAIKESLNNIAKHSGADAVTILFRAEKGKVDFIVTDNGKGFDMNETRQFANGVKNMQSRMKQAGGTCIVNSTAGKGTIITFTLCL